MDRTPLMALASNGLTEKISSILEAKPDIDLLENNLHGENALYFAIKNRQWTLLGNLAERPEIANRGVYSSKNKALMGFLNTMSLNEDVEFYENLWENTGLKPQVDILGTSLMRYDPSLSLMGMVKFFSS
jgi:ankyrin repeat protein